MSFLTGFICGIGAAFLSLCLGIGILTYLEDEKMEKDYEDWL